MRKIKVWMNIGFSGVEHKDIIEVEDEATEEEIEKEWVDWAWQYVDGGWERR